MSPDQKPTAAARAISSAVGGAADSFSVSGSAPWSTAPAQNRVFLDTRQGSPISTTRRTSAPRQQRRADDEQDALLRAHHLSEVNGLLSRLVLGETNHLGLPSTRV